MKDYGFALVYQNEIGQDTDELFLTIQRAYDYMKDHNLLGDKRIKVYRIEFELKEVPAFSDPDIEEAYLDECADAQDGGYRRDYFRRYDRITDVREFFRLAEEERNKYSNNQLS